VQHERAGTKGALHASGAPLIRTAKDKSVAIPRLQRSAVAFADQSQTIGRAALRAGHAAPE
jgi:hypothetical protein